MSEQPSGWAAGYAGFAGVMLVVVGFFQACAGLVALLNDEFFVVGQEWVFQFDVTTWGWIHLIVSIVILASGFGIFTGNVATGQPFRHGGHANCGWHHPVYARNCEPA